MTTSFERSAIIGFWRSGASLLDIATVMGMEITIDEVFRVIMNYFED